MRNPKQSSRAKTGEQAFQQMEDKLSSIHYFYRNADLPADIRQVMTYRKLLALDYFTPNAAQALLRQWIRAEPKGARATVSDLIPSPTVEQTPSSTTGPRTDQVSPGFSSRKTRPNQVPVPHQVRATRSSFVSGSSVSGSQVSSGISSRSTVSDQGDPASQIPSGSSLKSNPKPNSSTVGNTSKRATDPQVNELSSQLNAAVAQQQWEQAIQVLDEMIRLVPHQQVELSAYRDNLSALVGQV